MNIIHFVLHVGGPKTDGHCCSQPRSWLVKHQSKKNDLSECNIKKKEEVGIARDIRQQLEVLFSLHNNLMSIIVSNLYKENTEKKIPKVVTRV